jgi:hypothetical protein
MVVVMVVVVMVMGCNSFGGVDKVGRKSQGPDEILNHKMTLGTNFGEKLRVRVADDRQIRRS